MAERLHIIIPCARPQNLPLITKNLLIDQAPHHFEVRLHIMLQGPEVDPKGYFKVNEGSAMVTTSGLAWFPSDDTLQEPTLFQTLENVINLNPDAGMIVFSERRKGVCPWTGGAWPADSEPGIMRARPENMKRCRVDCTQIFWRKINPMFDFAKYGPEADGALISELHSKHPEWFVFVPDEFVVFGFLDP